MRIKSYLKLGLIVLVAVTILLSAMPAEVNADNFTRFWGLVNLGNTGVAPGSTVTASIARLNKTYPPVGVIIADGAAYYIIDIYQASGAMQGDIVSFSVNINGDVRNDSTTAAIDFTQLVFHSIRLPTNIPSITTASLPAGTQGSPYNFTVMASGGTPSYSWTSMFLPSGLGINAVSGVISGTPSVSGNFPVTIVVTDSGSPKGSTSKSFILTINSAGGNNIVITTTELPRSGVEVFPAGYPSSWNPLPPPGWIINQPYNATMAATGGTGSLSWNATNLPPGLSISAAGAVSGTPTTAGTYAVTFNVKDSASPPATASTTLTLKIYLAGDANGNGTVAVSDVTYVENVILGLKPPTAGCDANISLTIAVSDVTKIERIILGLP